jgi:hypothetical protein
MYGGTTQGSTTAHKFFASGLHINALFALSKAGTVLKNLPKFTLEDAIGSHASSLEASKRVTNGIPLGCSLLLPVGTVNHVETLQDLRSSELPKILIGHTRNSWGFCIEPNRLLAVDGTVLVFCTRFCVLKGGVLLER